MAEGRQLEEPPGGGVDVSGRLRSALRSGASAGLRTMFTTSLVMLVGLIALDVACTWLVDHYASVWAAVVAFVFTGITGALFAAYVVGVRAVGRGVIVGNEQAQLGHLVLDVTMSSVTAAADRGQLGASHLRNAGAVTRMAVGQLNLHVEGNALQRLAARRVLRLATRLVGEKVTETLVAYRGDLPSAARDLARTATSWLSAAVDAWMRTQTRLAIALTVMISGAVPVLAAVLASRT
jgi:hypothetical protein